MNITKREVAQLIEFHSSSSWKIKHQLLVADNKQARLDLSKVSHYPYADITPVVISRSKRIIHEFIATWAISVSYIM